MRKPVHMMRMVALTIISILAVTPLMASSHAAQIAAEETGTLVIHNLRCPDDTVPYHE